MTASSATGRGRFRRQGLAGRRTAVAGAAGLAALATAWAVGATWSVAVVSAWDVAAAVYLVRVWSKVRRLDGAGARRAAASEDGSRTAAEALLLAASVASLFAVGYLLVEAGRGGAGRQVALTALAVGSVLLAWGVVHTIFALRYARLFYAPPEGGLAFHEDDPPDYSDFAYVAFTIGMTFQVSDTDISKRPIRRAAIHHALLSYAFGTVILGIIISSIAALLGT
jgi:uncharacterized membrane protein